MIFKVSFVAHKLRANSHAKGIKAATLFLARINFASARLFS